MPEEIDKAISKLKKTYKSTMLKKMDVLKSFYEDSDFID